MPAKLLFKNAADPKITRERSRKYCISRIFLLIGELYGISLV
jgi:hypothetical protein